MTNLPEQPQHMAEALGIELLYDEDLPDFAMNMYPRLEWVDGPTAEKYLEYNIEPEIGQAGSNRRSRVGRVIDNAEKMEAGKWLLTHQGIAFDTEGNLIDGAHRLKAIRVAAKKQPDLRVMIWVFRNVPVESQEVFDIGGKRILGDMMVMKGHSSGSVGGKALSLIWQYVNCDFDAPIDEVYWNRPVDSATVLALRGEFPELDDIVAKCRRFSPPGSAARTAERIMAPSAASAALIIINRAYPGRVEETEEFFDRLYDGTNLDTGSAILALRRGGINRLAKGVNRQSWLQMGHVLKAYKMYRTGERPDAKMIVLRPGERFPRP